MIRAMIVVSPMVRWCMERPEINVARRRYSRRTAIDWDINVLFMVH